jgi:short-subunit dehydrogenase
MSLCPGPVATSFQARAGLRSAEQLSRLRVPSAAAVAAEGYAGFKAGARQVIPGLANKLVAYAGRGAPRRVVLPIASHVTSRAKA